MFVETLEHKKHSFFLVILALLSILLYFTGSNQLSLTHPDEVFYIQTAKEMLHHNNFLTPYIFDQPQFEKPILSYWLFALAIKVFGLTPFAGRFFPAFFAAIGVLATYWLGYLLFGRKKEAFFSALILSTSIIYVALARAVLTDMIFSVIVLLAITFFYWGLHSSKYYNQGMLLGFAFSALAVLTKGVLGMIFPWTIVLLYLAFTKQLNLLRPKILILGIVVFLIIALPWHLYMYKLYGQDFIKEYWNNVHVRRLYEAEHRRLDNFYFYPALMIMGVLPWFIIWPTAILNVVGHWKRNSIEKKPLLFLLIWIAVVYVIMQAAHSKLASYIFPLFPAIALFLGFGLAQALRRESPTLVKVLRASCAFIALVFFAMSIGVVIAGHMYHDFMGHSLWLVYGGGLFLLVLAIVMFFVFKSNKVERVVPALSLFTVGFLLVMAFSCHVAEPWVSCKKISEEFNKIDQSDSVILTSKFYVRGVRFYTDRKMAVIDINGSGFFSAHPIPFLTTEDQVVDLLKSQPVTYAIVKEGNVEDLKRIISSRRDFKLEDLSGFGGKYILRIERIEPGVKI